MRMTNQLVEKALIRHGGSFTRIYTMSGDSWLLQVDGNSSRLVVRLEDDEANEFSLTLTSANGVVYQEARLSGVSARTMAVLAAAMLNAD